MIFPKFIRDKKCIATIYHHHPKSLAYAIMFHLHPKQIHQSDFRRIPYFNSCIEKFYPLNIKYPVHPKELEALEPQIQMRINLYSFHGDGKQRFLVYQSRMPRDYPEINLLYAKGQYALITDFSRFLCDLHPKRYRQYYCRQCFDGFKTNGHRYRHELVCQNLPLYPKPKELSRMKFLLICITYIIVLNILHSNDYIIVL